MNPELLRPDISLQKDIINLQNRYSGNLMDVRRTRTAPPPLLQKRKPELLRSLSQNSPRRLIPSSYFSLESLLLLLCLTAFLLFLPLILPPLPPPPFLLLLVPIVILAVLMILALMPTSYVTRDRTSSYM